MKETKFKQTEVGMIPSDWEVKTLGKLYKVHNGLSKGKQFFGHGYPFLSFSVVFNNVFIPNKLENLVDSSKEERASYSINKGDVFITRTSETVDELGMSCVALKDYPNATYNGFCKRLRPNDVEFVNLGYLGFYLRSDFIREWFLKFSTVTTRASLKNDELLSLPLVLPPTIEEQQRIANTLSDVDTLITNLEKLIAKKKNIKQGAMQQLLTGKKRLPGFGGKWNKKVISKLGYTYNGLSGKIASDFGKGSAQYITFLNVLNNPVVDKHLFQKVNVSEAENQNKVLKDDLLFNTSSEVPEEVGICSVLKAEVPNLYLNSFCFGFRLTDTAVDGLFLSYYFRSPLGRSLMSLLAQGSTRYNLSKDNFLKSSIVIPSSKTEQTAIANVLSDMDTEISALETKLAKYRTLKTGMMQQLLTGKIRLV